MVRSRKFNAEFFNDIICYVCEDVLSMVREQMEILRKVVSEQGETISNMNAKEEESKSTIAALNQRVQTTENRIGILEKQLSLKEESEMNHSVLLHERQIIELLERPLIDPEQTIRLDVVEKKLASFYGDDINILGRVAHLENLRVADKCSVDDLKSGHNNVVKVSADSQAKILELQQNLSTRLEPRLESLEQSHSSTDTLKRLVCDTIQEKGMASIDQVNDIMDMFNLLANECKKDVNALQVAQDDTTMQLSSRIDLLEEAQSTPGNLHHGPITCFGSDQSARLAAIEAKLIDHSDWIGSHGRIADNISRLKEDVSKIIASLDHLNEECRRNGTSVDRLDTDYLRMVHVVEGTRSHVEGLDRTFNVELAEKVKDLESLIAEAARQSKPPVTNEQLIAKETADSGHLEESVDKIKEFIRTLEQRVFVLAGECREGLELLQGNVDKKIEIISNWVANNSNGSAGMHKGMSSNAGTRKTSKDPIVRTKVPDILRSAVTQAREDLQQDNNPLRRDFIPLNISSSYASDLENKEEGMESSARRYLHMCALLSSFLS
jgi:putative ubiquitin-RnfH superfamily antitoxin RatB of RatAB toxin-antitoxin module